MSSDEVEFIEAISDNRIPFLVDGTAVARSEPVDDELEWLRVYDSPNRYSHVTGYHSFTYGTGQGLERARNALLAGTDDSLFYQRLVDVVTGRPAAGATLELTASTAGS